MIDYIPNLQLALTLTVTGIGIGYLAMRRIINEFIHVGGDSRSEITKILGPRNLTNPIHENNEILTLTQTFYEVKQRLEKDIQELKITKSNLHSVLSKVSQAVSTTSDIDTFLQLIVDTATDAFLGKSGLILLIDKKNNEVYIESMAGVEIKDIQKKRFKIQDSIWEMVINSKTPVVISKDELEPFFSQQTNFLEPPLLCSPLIINNEAQGMLIISGRRIFENYQEDDRNLINAVALQTAVILNNVELKTLASIDPLTSLYNYRHLVERLDYEIARLKRYEGVLCLLILDVDNFKGYNDSFGHVDGDQLLQRGKDDASSNKDHGYSLPVCRG